MSKKSKDSSSTTTHRNPALPFFKDQVHSVDCEERGRRGNPLWSYVADYSSSEEADAPHLDSPRRADTRSPKSPPRVNDKADDAPHLDSPRRADVRNPKSPPPVKDEVEDATGRPSCRATDFPCQRSRTKLGTVLTDAITFQIFQSQCFRRIDGSRIIINAKVTLEPKPWRGQETPTETER